MTSDRSARSDADAAEKENTSPLEPVPMEPVPPPERRTRAGRNLPAAIGVGVGMGALVLASLFFVRAVFLGVVAVGVVLGTWETVRAFGRAAEPAKRTRPPLVPLLAVIALGALGTGLAVLIQYGLVAEVGPTTAQMVTYFIPVIATAAGVAILGESLTWSTPVGSPSWRMESPPRAAALRRPTSSARSRAGSKRGAISGRSLPLHLESTFRRRSRRATSQVVCSPSSCPALG